MACQEVFVSLLTWNLIDLVLQRVNYPLLVCLLLFRN